MILEPSTGDITDDSDDFFNDEEQDNEEFSSDDEAVDNLRLGMSQNPGVMKPGVMQYEQYLRTKNINPEYPVEIELLEKFA